MSFSDFAISSDIPFYTAQRFPCSQRHSLFPAPATSPSIPPAQFGEVSVEFERVLDISRNRRSRNTTNNTAYANGLNHDPLSVSASDTRNVLHIDGVGIAFVNGSLSNTVHIVHTQDPIRNTRKCEHSEHCETPRFVFTDRIHTLINLTRELPRIGVVLSDGTVHLLVRMRMLPWILADTIEPELPRFVSESMTVSYSFPHNCLLWLLQRGDQNNKQTIGGGQRTKHKLSFELWVYHMNWPAEVLTRSKKRPDYMLAQGLPGPGRVLAFSDHILVFFYGGVISLPYSKVLFNPVPTLEALKTKIIPEIELWQPVDCRPTRLQLNELQLRSPSGLALRGVFYNLRKEYGMAIFGDVCFKYAQSTTGLSCMPMFHLANVQIPIAPPPSPLRFIYDEQDSETLIVHDGSYLCLMHRKARRRGKRNLEVFFRDIPGALEPTDGIATALFRPMVGSALFVKVVRSYMLKGPLVG